MMDIDTSQQSAVSRLVGLVQQMVIESGDPEGFDAAAWVAEWLASPLPALDGQKPAAFMDTEDGQARVFNLVGRMQTGAYS